MTFGMYQPEEEYGLLDGFKFNLFKKRDKGEKLIEIKSETAGEKERLEREKLKPKASDSDEYEQYRFLREGVVTF
ncbi:hypothetical protein tpqmel_0091 [Candidatus Gastranaerophilus sp. (ex Termes propinquus)]|nr:hypothetical protein tpqmel_0091 [Candidatus Gastranaerophilus sp. (ex Termes propinquus)]